MDPRQGVDTRYASIFAYGSKLNDNPANKPTYDLFVSKLANEEPRKWLKILGQKLLLRFLFNAVIGYVRHSGALTIHQLTELTYETYHLIIFRTFVYSITNRVNTNVYLGMEKIIHECAVNLFGSLTN
jgi:hypothetical protein